ncbi:MAG: hypothetical protein IKW86_00315 [Salinivirgaceae bacterium]|nr:hypothetical protein [Salinivirgaceae bacterium]
MINSIINKYLDRKDTSDLSWRIILNFRSYCYRLITRQPNYIKANLELNNIYKGKRCFILGNGPSLNQLDFRMLKDEYVFTVNMLMEHEKFSELNSNFHVMVDDAIFRSNDNSGLEKDYYLNKIKKLYQYRDLILFVPYRNANEIKKKGIDKNINVRYLHGYNHYKSIGRIQIDKIMPAFNKVIQYAIAIAIYMGFDEINLLGCEETGILPFINLIMTGETNDDHCYKDTDDEKKSWGKWILAEGISHLFEDQAMVFRRYELISDYCNKNKIILQNLTPNTLIDSVNKMQLEKVLRGNINENK